MAANCPPQMASLEDDHQSISGEGGESPDISSVVLGRLGQIVCAMHGHDNLIQFEQNRMFLKCASCGHETPGWTLPDRRPVARFSGARREPVTTAIASIDEVKRVA